MTPYLSPPSARQRRPWFVLFGSGFALMFSSTVVVQFSFSLFVIPISEDTGFSRAVVSGGVTALLLGTAVGSVIVGILLDRFAAHYIAVTGFLMQAVMIACIAVIPASPVLFILAFMCTGVFGAVSACCIKAIVSWFDNKRALSLGLFASFGALGNTFMPVIVAALLNTVGWRNSYLVLALFPLILSMGAALCFIRVRGERYERGRIRQVTEGDGQGDGVVPAVPGLTLRESMRTRQFWMLTLGIGLASISLGGLTAHLVPMAVSRGIDAGKAAVLLSTIAIAGAVGRIVGGFILDRVPANIFGSVILVLPVGGILLLQPSLSVSVLGSVLIGFAIGVEGDLVPLLSSRYFGLRWFGRVQGVVNAAFVVFQGIGPLIFGIVYDATGSYDVLVPMLIVLLVCGGVLVALLGTYRFPAVSGFDKLAAREEDASSISESTVTDPDADAVPVSAR